MLSQYDQRVNQAPFCPDLLMVDEPLWGSFWQGDVIAPGYILPAIELAMLRAIRLDGSWSAATSPHSYLADLHQAMAAPTVTVQQIMVADTRCLVYATPTVDNPCLSTVAWYCPTTEYLHAGYRTITPTRPAVEMPDPLLEAATDLRLRQLAWLSESVTPSQPPTDRAAHLDGAILRYRLAALDLVS